MVRARLALEQSIAKTYEKCYNILYMAISFEKFVDSPQLQGELAQALEQAIAEVMGEKDPRRVLTNSWCGLASYALQRFFGQPDNVTVVGTSNLVTPFLMEPYDFQHAFLKGETSDGPQFVDPTWKQTMRFVTDCPVRSVDDTINMPDIAVFRDPRKFGEEVLSAAFRVIYSGVNLPDGTQRVPNRYEVLDVGLLYPAIWQNARPLPESIRQGNAMNAQAVAGRMTELINS